MKSRISIFVSILLFITLCSFTNSGDNPGKRKINNDLYSITLPSDWKPYQGTKGDGIVPQERNGGPFHLHFIHWATRYAKVFESEISVNIKSYQLLDGTPLSVKDIEDMTLSSKKNHPMIKNFKMEVLPSKNGQRRLMSTEKGQNLQGGYDNIRGFHIIQKGKGMVHHLNLSLMDEYYSKPDVQKMINEILDSFSVK